MEEAWEGVPNDCLCPLPRLKNWEVGAGRGWGEGDNLRLGGDSCHLWLFPTVLELDNVCCGAP